MATFCGESYSIGYIEALFSINKLISSEHCKRYLELCDKVGQAKDGQILTYIINNYPKLIK